MVKKLNHKTESMNYVQISNLLILFNDLELLFINI